MKIIDADRYLAAQLAEMLTGDTLERDVKAVSIALAAHRALEGAPSTSDVPLENFVNLAALLDSEAEKDKARAAALQWAAYMIRQVASGKYVPELYTTDRFADMRDAQDPS